MTIAPEQTDTPYRCHAGAIATPLRESSRDTDGSLGYKHKTHALSTGRHYILRGKFLACTKFTIRSILVALESDS